MRPGIVAEGVRDDRSGPLWCPRTRCSTAEQDHGLGYREEDVTEPRNPYGASKLAGELAAQEAFGDGRGL